jgi:hypothetical protein
MIWQETELELAKGQGHAKILATINQGPKLWSWPKICKLDILYKPNVPELQFARTSITQNPKLFW